MQYAESHLKMFHDKHALEIWKSKSLNSMPTQTYMITLDQTESGIRKQVDGLKNQQGNTQALPQPKVSKINEAIFCIYLHNQLNVFKYMAQQQKSFKKLNHSFCQIRKLLFDRINFVTGNSSQFIYVVLNNLVVIYGLKWENRENDSGQQLKILIDIIEVCRLDIDKVKQITFINQYDSQSKYQYLIAVSDDTYYKFYIKDNFHLTMKTRILFDSPVNQQVYMDSKPIYLLTENEKTIYLFSVVQENRPFITDISERQGTSNRLCQVLYLTRIIVERSEQGSSVIGFVSPIDHVFEKNIFGKSKVFLLGQSAFLMSLHEQIIVMQENFSKYIVLDNISLVASKSSEKKGQLILADKIVMVYTEMGQIFAQNIYYSNTEGLKTPRIDNFKGNENDEQILYDAIVLQYQPGSFMKVLIYFTKSQVFTPNQPPNSNAVNKQYQASNQKGKLKLTILCIQQDSPVNKLGELFRNKKPPNEINEFVERFNIDELTRSKCEWSVSQKAEKDIENLLLQIKDNEFIQQQLTKILKSSPHDIKFLNMIETKQIARYKKMLVTKILKSDDAEHNQPESGYYSAKQINYLKDIMRWLMESIMFKKKLAYCKNFLQFKEYDFIEIGKLKAASLKQQIKLLSCKGFQKRLQYFLNSFKYMALYDFEDIFCFLINDKNEEEVQDFFIKYYPFVLPNFQEDSDIFRKKKKMKDSLQLIEKIAREHSDCELWVYNFNRHDIYNRSAEEREKIQAELAKIQTVASFEEDILREIQVEKKKQGEFVIYIQSKYNEASLGFTSILNSFINQQWFVNNISKQHSILSTKIEQLEQKFLYLKRIGVFHILIKLFYEKIAKNEYSQQKIDEVLQQYTMHGLIPQSFVANVSARKQVYRLMPRGIGICKPVLSEFLIQQETEYFWFLFNNYRRMLLKQIKRVYDNKQLGFFRQKFKIFLVSKGMEIKKIIDFLDQFQENINEDIRMDVFARIKQLLIIDDQQNTKMLVNKLMDMQILKNQLNNQAIIELIDEAKVVFGYYFFNFFKIFQLKYSYNQLIEYTFVKQFEKNDFILTIMERYVAKNQINQEENSLHDNQYIMDQQQVQSQLVVKFEQMYGLNEIKPINLRGEPMEFFSLLLYMIDSLRFQVESTTIFDEMVRMYLNQTNFQGLAEFIEKMQLEGLDIDEANMSYRNYALLNEFLESNDCNERLTNCVIRWIRQSYISLIDKPSKPQQFSEVFEIISSALEALNELMTQSKIHKEISFLNMLKNIEELQPSLLVYVLTKRYEHFTKEERSLMKQRSEYALKPNELQQNSQLLTSLSGFLFMTRLITNINKEKFAITQKEQITNQLSLMQTIYQYFIESSSYKNPEEAQSINAGYFRFNNELVLRLIRFENFQYCFQAVLKSINSQFYFRDVIFSFLALVKINKNNQDNFKSFISRIIATDSKIKMSNQIKSFFSQSGISSFQTQCSLREQTARIIFMRILQTRRFDEAFFFLTRDNHLSIIHTIGTCKPSNRDLFSYGIVAIYLKCLRQHLCAQFYPTFHFFKDKHAMLINQFERKDIVKDLNIAISKMREQIANKQIELTRLNKQLAGEVFLPQDIKSNIRKRLEQENQIDQQEKRQKIKERSKIQNYKSCLAVSSTALRSNLKELEQLYQQYMLANGFDPQIKFTEEKIGQKHYPVQASIQDEDKEWKVSILPGTVYPNIKQSGSKKEGRSQQVEQKIKKLKSENRFIDLQQKINKQAIESSKVDEKYQKIIEQKKHRQQPSGNYMSEYQKLKEKEKDEIESVKSNYKSEATERVNKLIQEMRIRRNKIVSNSSQLFQGLSRGNTDKHLPIFKKQTRTNFIRINAKDIDNDNKYATESIKKGLLSNTTKETTIKQNPVAPYLQQIWERKQNLGVPFISSYRNQKETIEQILELFAQREPQCKKYIEKLEFVRNNVQLGAQIIKNIYQSIYNFDMFIKFLNFLLNYDPKYKNIVEEKACKVATQALGIQYKINYKQLFPIEFFTDVVNISLGQYYQRAYEIVRPNLIKIMSKPDINVHGLAILFRYGFGSENRYYYQVYEDYTRTLIKQYSDNDLQEKMVFILAEKLRTLYSNISAENKAIKFENLIRQIKSQEKRRKLTQQILKVIERRRDMFNDEKPSDLEVLLEKFAWS